MITAQVDSEKQAIVAEVTEDKSAMVTAETDRQGMAAEIERQALAAETDRQALAVEVDRQVLAAETDKSVLISAEIESDKQAAERQSLKRTTSEVSSDNLPVAANIKLTSQTDEAVAGEVVGDTIVNGQVLVEVEAEADEEKRTSLKKQ